MITLLYGPSGSGKTHTILEKMKRDADAGIRSFLIVPEQETVSIERTALTVLPPSAQLSSEVLNFSRLANRVFREYGGLSYHYADKGAKAFLMHKTVRELLPLLESFEQNATADASLSEWLLSAVGELKASAVTAPELERAAAGLSEDDPLRKKLRDLAMIYSAYTGLVSESFDDSADDLTKLAELLKKHDFFKGAHVYIDSFTSYTKQELNVIAEIARDADALTVSFACPSPDAKELYLASVVDTSQRVRRAIGSLPAETVILTGNHRAKSESLTLLSENLWRLDLTKETAPVFPADVRDHVVLSVSDSVYAEAERAALRILGLVRKGYRYRDIVVVARDASALTGVIDFIFDKYGIPYYLSEKEDLISLAPVKLLLAALRVLALRFASADVIALLKTGLFDVSPSDVDLFEEYVSTWGITGSDFTRAGDWDMNPDGFTDRPSKRAKPILDAANRVKNAVIPHLLRLSDALKSAERIKDQTDALLTFLAELRLDEKLIALSKEASAMGRRQTADIYARLYGVLTDLLDKIARLSPEGSDEPVSPEELEGFVRILLRSTDIGTIPTAVDEVTIGSANMLRASNVRCAILLGLAEGEFPAAVSDNGMFSSADREKLQRHGVDLSYSYDFRSQDELLYVKRAVSLPSDLLVLSTHTAGANGASARPSLPFLRAKLLLGYEDADVEYGRGIKVTDHVLTPRLSLDYYPALKHTAAGEALRRLYAESGRFDGMLDTADVPVSDTAAAVSRDCAELVLGDRMTLSQSRIELYVKCHFAYYCRYILSLRESEPAAFGAIESGNFIHRILERFFRDAMHDGDGLRTFSRAEIEALADGVIEDYKKEILPPSMQMEDTGRLPHLYRRLRELSIMMIENILEEFEASEFRPRFFELSIGGSGAPAPLTFTLKDGSALSLSGQIDRVDLYKKDGRLYIRVVDYKTGTKDFSLSDLKDGLNTQMLIYLFTLCHASRFLASELADGSVPTPAGALYHSSALSALSLDSYPDSTDTDVYSLAEKEFKRTGILLKNDDVLLAMNKDLDPTYLPGIKTKTDKGKTAYLDEDRLASLESEISGVICGIAETMRSGNANAVPLEHGGKILCTYCKMRPLCRRTESLPTADGDAENDGKE